MTEANVALIRKLYELMPSPREALTEDLREVLGDYIDPSFELHLPAEYPEGEQVMRGHAGREKISSVLQETWREWNVEPERFVDAGDQVLVFARLIAVGHESGVPIEIETSHVWSIRDGRAASMQVYRDRAEALKAVSLAPEDVAEDVRRD